jgi:hypothetical protein
MAMDNSDLGAVSMSMRFVMALLTVLLAPSLSAQKVYTAQDYKQAERWLSPNTRPLMRHTVRDITYLKDGRVFYRDGDVYLVANPAKATKVAAFDNEKLAAALRKASGRDVKSANIIVETYTPDVTGSGFTVDLGRVVCARARDKACAQSLDNAVDAHGASRQSAVRSLAGRNHSCLHPRQQPVAAHDGH